MTYTTREYRIGRSIKSYDITNGRIDGSKWGLTDLYPEAERNLRELLTSNEDFETDWSSRKECWSAYIRRVNGICSVTVCVNIDDLWESTDLIDNALYDLNLENTELSEDDIEYIRDAAFECDVDDHADAKSELRNPDYEDLMEEIERLTDKATAAADRNYEVIKSIVMDCVNTKEEKQ